MPDDKLGWIEPVFYGNVNGEPLGVFTDEQMAKIQAGYGCPRCWQEFKIIFTKCPVCELDLQDEWKPGPDDDRVMKPLRRAKT